MTNPSTLIPAYGRDYKSAKAVREDFYNNKDFTIADIMNPWDGKPCNLAQLDPGTVQIRYQNLTKVLVAKIS